MRCLIFGLIISAIACGSKKDKKPPEPDTRIEQLTSLFNDKKIEAESIRDPHNAWIVPNDCDGMLWSGKYASVDCGVDIEAAEVEPGRFDRYPQMGTCRTSWSRDMGVAGLFVWAYKCNRRDVLERHAKYGKKNNWVMGEPVDDGRPIYTPQMIGLLYQIIFKMGGDNDPNRVWPHIYPSGLDGYQAHLQMMAIWHRANHEPISQTMYERIKEHYDRIPYNPFYAFMKGLYTGDMSTTIDLLLSPEMPMAGYVRCDEPHRCKLAEWLFVTDEVLKWYEQNNN
jgi:hypothetical protein